MLDIELIQKYRNELSDFENSFLDLYIDEAQFFANLFKDNLSRREMELYEIGSGIGLLARIFAENGHYVTATEPARRGFTIVKKLDEIILKSFKSLDPRLSGKGIKNPVFFEETAENISDLFVQEGQTFDLAYCANVVEHVNDLETFVGCIMPTLKTDGTFRFICPNYAFPYEPHFGFLIFFNKRITRFFQIKKIETSHLEDAVNFYEDLSWPTPLKIKNKLKKFNYEINFSKNATRRYVTRALTDKFFIARKPLISRLVKLLKPIIFLLIALMPIQLCPIIDCEIKNKKT